MVLSRLDTQMHLRNGFLLFTLEQDSLPVTDTRLGQKIRQALLGKFQKLMVTKFVLKCDLLPLKKSVFKRISLDSRKNA